MEENNKVKAVEEFLMVKNKSPNYVQARYSVVRSNIEILEKYSSKNLSQSKQSIKLYSETTAQLAELRTLFKRQKNKGKTNEMELHSSILLAKLYIYGPEKTLKKGLKALAGIETRFSEKKNQELFVTVRKLKMECYRKLNMFIEAEKEITELIKPSDLDLHEWTLLNEVGGEFYNTSLKFRNKNSNELADKHAELAIMIYQKLFLVAADNSSYNRFYNPIQLRLAELYRDVNKTETAKEIYLDNLEQNPESADAIYNLGLISEQQGRWEEALKTWRKFSDGVSNGSHYWFESRYHTAKALYNLGKVKSACEILNMTIILHPKLRDEEFKIEFMKLKNNICSN
jgi:tetratricopeptide (TPR) repeat protein